MKNNGGFSRWIEIRKICKKNELIILTQGSQLHYGDERERERKRESGGGLKLKLKIKQNSGKERKKYYESFSHQR